MEGSNLNGNLPVPLSKLIGRERELESLRQLMDTGARLITLTGPGGVGKTRLALEITSRSAENYTHGAAFISLEALEQPDQVLPTIASGLGIEQSGSQQILDDLRTDLAATHALVCIDNWEQVIDAAPQLAQFLSACPRLQVIATSREALRLRGEQEFPVDPLGLSARNKQEQSPAINLFAERAKSANPTFALDETNTPVVAEICNMLDGLPLAIELAAAMIRLFSPHALLSRLKGSQSKGRSSLMQVLGSGARDLPARQRSMRSIIDWSYTLLDDDEQKILRWIAVFSGGCDLEAAETVCSAAGSLKRPIVDLLVSLVDKSLLRADQSTSQPRFKMLRTIQEYALEQLDSSGLSDQVRQSHSDYYLNLVERAENGLKGAERGEWLERLDREHDNLRSVLAWTIEQENAPAAFLLGGTLWRFWFIRGYRTEGNQWLSKILSMKGNVPAALRANVLNGAGGLALMRYENDVAKRYFDECLELRRSIEDWAGVSATNHNLAHMAFRMNDFTAAYSHIQESLEIDLKLGDQSGIASGHYTIGMILISLKDYALAEQHIKEGLVISQALGDEWQIGLSNSMLGDLSIAQGYYDEAYQYLNKSKEIFLKFGDSGQVSGIKKSLGYIAIQQGKLQDAETDLFDSLKIAHENIDTLMIADALAYLACLAAARSNMVKAARIWGASEFLRASIASRPSEDNQADFDHYIQLAKKQMGERAFNAERKIGAGLSLEQAIQYATGVEVVEEPKVPAKTMRKTLPAGLTAREADVLRCVADGLTDFEVADKLVISPRTVNAHLTSVYGKLGVSSRAAATRYAIQNGLAA